MKKMLLAALMICILAALPLLACAEIEPDILYQYMPSIKPVSGTGFVTMESKQDNTLGLFTTDGKQVIPYGNVSLNSLGSHFFSAAKDKAELNGLAIYKDDGRQISDYLYGRVTVYNRNWIAGIVLEIVPPEEEEEETEESIAKEALAEVKEEETEEEERIVDLSFNGVDYLIVRWDLYYVTDEAMEGVSYLVASLDREQFAAAKQHGDRISIQDREGNVTVYDRLFRPLDIKVANVASPLYVIKNFQVVDLQYPGIILASGYDEVTEIELSGRTLLSISTTDFTGAKSTTVLDLGGNLLIPADYSVVTMGDPYVVVANADGLRGLFDLDAGKLIVPCEFSKIVEITTSVSRYVNNGYVAVEKDGKRGYVNAETGETTYEPTINARIARTYGCSTVFDGEDGFVLVAGDGVRTELFDYEAISETHGDGTLLVAKKGGFYGIIDWHGNEMFPFIHNNDIVITDDTQAMIRTSTGLELDKINR